MIREKKIVVAVVGVWTPGISRQRAANHPRDDRARCGRTAPRADARWPAGMWIGAGERAGNSPPDCGRMWTSLEKRARSSTRLPTPSPALSTIAVESQASFHSAPWLSTADIPIGGRRVDSRYAGIRNGMLRRLRSPRVAPPAVSAPSCQWSTMGYYRPSRRRRRRWSPHRSGRSRPRLANRRPIPPYFQPRRRCCPTSRRDS